jgi:hypothetical protein
MATRDESKGKSIYLYEVERARRGHGGIEPVVCINRSDQLNSHAVIIQSILWVKVRKYLNETWNRGQISAGHY